MILGFLSTLFSCDKKVKLFKDFACKVSQELSVSLGANIFIYPGAFNMVTGPAHWELLQRARAMDNNGNA